MKHSDSLKAFAPALVAAQKAITFAAKDATNPHFKNKYADLPAVIEAVKPALNDAGITYIQTASPSDDGKLHLTTTLLHSSGEWISDTMVMPLPKQDPQGYGSAMTYARRYSLAGITGVYQDDDDGNAASGVQPKAVQRSEPAQVQHEPGESDAEYVARFNAAASVPDLVKVMNSVPAPMRAAVKPHFDQRMTQLKEAA